ncbi:trans isomerase NIMA-interacting 1 [Seminavis robusta]|uniref:Peptidyl-prolyl cis-trans isomerase n=1 Tax=Seminavis robusta TaxID=568900 RepID=A0A9N8EPS9_9STRA|nr:trans isomerase NIMA-interacting 1 [Seminavis robusta]|eukprot:Sro1552_g281810.1 trans isomerase NIMA-interacting 1 (278) ;mRNA; f:15599-16432
MAESSPEIATTTGSATASTEVPDAAVVSLVDAVSHALDNKAVLRPIPPPLPTGWVMREARSQPNYYLYYNMETGESTWYSPIEQAEHHQLRGDEDQAMMDSHNATEVPFQESASARTAHSGPENSGDMDNDNNTSSRKRPHEDMAAGNTPNKKPAKSSGKPSKVRILHILKKHSGSRRPSSWRQAKITATKEEAREELQGLVDILKEETGADQRATFEEIARTESDCSSAKRGGDLGFFGPKKMQPAFEEASFALQIGELSGIVETSSGVHVLLRIG